MKFALLTFSLSFCIYALILSVEPMPLSAQTTSEHEALTSYRIQQVEKRVEVIDQIRMDMADVKHYINERKAQEDRSSQVQTAVVIGITMLVIERFWEYLTRRRREQSAT